MSGSNCWRLLDLVAEEDRAEGGLGVGREDLERVAAHAERAADEVAVVALVLDVDELAQQRRGRPSRPLEQVHALVVLSGDAEAVDARDTLATTITSRAANSACGGVPQPVDLLVDGRVLLDVEVRAGT